MQHGPLHVQTQVEAFSSLSPATKSYDQEYLETPIWLTMYSATEWSWLLKHPALHHLRVLWLLWYHVWEQEYTRCKSTSAYLWAFDLKLQAQAICEEPIPGAAMRKCDIQHCWLIRPYSQPRTEVPIKVSTEALWTARACRASKDGMRRLLVDTSHFQVPGRGAICGTPKLLTPGLDTTYFSKGKIDPSLVTWRRLDL